MVLADTSSLAGFFSFLFSSFFLCAFFFSVSLDLKAHRMRVLSSHEVQFSQVFSTLTHTASVAAKEWRQNRKLDTRQAPTCWCPSQQLVVRLLLKGFLPACPRVLSNTCRIGFGTHSCAQKCFSQGRCIHAAQKGLNNSTVHSSTCTRNCKQHANPKAEETAKSHRQN